MTMADNTFHQRKELRKLCQKLANGDWQVLSMHLLKMNKNLEKLIPFKEGDRVTLLNDKDRIPSEFVGTSATVTEVNTGDYEAVVVRLDFDKAVDGYCKSGWLSSVQNIKKVS